MVLGLVGWAIEPVTEAELPVGATVPELVPVVVPLPRVPLKVVSRLKVAPLDLVPDR